jgi:hypothetical protein
MTQKDILELEVIHDKIPNGSMTGHDFYDFFVTCVNCTSNSLVITNESANVNMPKK